MEHIHGDGHSCEPSPVLDDNEDPCSSDVPVEIKCPCGRFVRI